MTGYESKKAMAQDKITDEQGRPMTYWGGKAQPEQEPVAYTLNCVCGAVWDIKADGSEEMAHTPDTTPPQPAQEPSYWLGYGLQSHTEKPFNDATPLYTAPPQRPWVGLTAEEAAECWTTSATQTWKNIEAKLKEKNT